MGRYPQEIDAVVLAGGAREAVLAGEARWGPTVDGVAVARGLRKKVAALPRVRDDLRIGVCAREEVRGDADLLMVTAEDIFTP